MISTAMDLLYTFIILGLLKANFVAARWSTWGSWGHCSVTCGTGTKVSHRTCSHGSCEGSSTRTEHCHPTPHTCPPVDGHMTAWTHWYLCSATCEGTRKRFRVCHPPEHGGAPCYGNTVETSGCGTSHCPVDGHLTAWTHWSHCSATCEGTSKRTRVCHPPVHGGAPCVGDTSEISRCGTLHCPVDGRLNDWEPWSSCSGSCEGLRSRTRTCSPPHYGGVSCTGQTTQTAKCGTEHCPVDGRLSDWGSWSQCSATCEGLKSRNRTCIPPQYGGASCTGQTTQTTKCGTEKCPGGVVCPTINENLEYTWNTTCQVFETCIVRNFPGFQFTTHCIMKDDCAIMKILQRTPEQIFCCDDESCLQNILGEGRLSDWGSWSQCSGTCEGFKNRTRTCNPQQDGDVPCINVTQTAKCGTEHCPVDGDLSAWGDWSPCSVTCGTGTRVRSRTCIPPQYGGHNCTGPMFEMNTCSQMPCPTSSIGVTCPTCTDSMVCTWNTTCHVTENCMVRAFPGFKFTTHCIMKDDCALMKLLGKTHGQILCCDDESCLRTLLGD